MPRCVICTFLCTPCVVWAQRHIGGRPPNLQFSPLVAGVVRVCQHLLLFQSKMVLCSSNITSPKASLAGAWCSANHGAGSRLPCQAVLAAVAADGCIHIYACHCANRRLSARHTIKLRNGFFPCRIPLGVCHAIIAYNGYGNILPASAWLVDGHDAPCMCMVWCCCRATGHLELKA